MPPVPLQVIGLCRFSVLSSGGFQSMPDDLAARRAALYDPARLARRFAWFEEVALPPLRAQSDPDFRLVVLTGVDLPEAWRARLDRAVASLPQAVVEAVPPGDHRAQCGAALARHVERRGGVVAQVRMDDDDAVATDFVEVLRGEAGRLARHFRGRLPFAVDFAKGAVLAVDAGGDIALTPNLAQFWTPALAIVFAEGARDHLMSYPHNRVWRRMPTVTLTDPVMYLRGAHGGNDSTAPRGSDDFRLPPAPDLLAARFAIDPGRLRAALAPLADPP